MQEKELYGIRFNAEGAGLPENWIGSYEGQLKFCQARLASGTEAFTGWYHLPAVYDRGEFERICKTAEEIRSKCTAFVSIGIGGSYLGARAAIEYLKPQNGWGADAPTVYFAGQNLSSAYHKALLEALESEEVCICVISKSGTTVEPSIAFSLLKEFLIRKYGKEEARRRIYTITDCRKGVLREETEREGYVNFIVPDDIGGRYSVLSPVGLLPIAVAGIDIETMMNGAASEYRKIQRLQENGAGGPDDGMRYAAARNEWYRRGKQIEVFEAYEPRLFYFTEWLKQLFGESEGKDGKGLFPAGLQFSTDLHSMGQFLQEGSPCVLETVLNLEEPGVDLIVPKEAGADFAGRSMNDVNRAARDGVTEAHRQAGVPVLRIDLPGADAASFGAAVWFFERACGLSAYLLDVDPFHQPGVEAYKQEMRKALK